MVCSCNNKPVSGCTDDLSSKNCANPFKGGCQNPSRGTVDHGVALKAESHSYFASCQGAAYTWDTDDTASIFGICSGTIDCCVGTDGQGCPKFNKEQKKWNKAGKCVLCGKHSY